VVRETGSRCLCMSMGVCQRARVMSVPQTQMRVLQTPHQSNTRTLTQVPASIESSTLMRRFCTQGVLSIRLPTMWLPPDPWPDNPAYLRKCGPAVPPAPGPFRCNLIVSSDLIVSLQSTLLCCEGRTCEDAHSDDAADSHIAREVRRWWRGGGGRMRVWKITCRCGCGAKGR
jgi:hypothetical protein